MLRLIALEVSPEKALMPPASESVTDKIPCRPQIQMIREQIQIHRDNHGQHQQHDNRTADHRSRHQPAKPRRDLLLKTAILPAPCPNPVAEKRIENCRSREPDRKPKYQTNLEHVDARKPAMPYPSNTKKHRIRQHPVTPSKKPRPKGRGREAQKTFTVQAGRLPSITTCSSIRREQGFRHTRPGHLQRHRRHSQRPRPDTDNCAHGRDRNTDTRDSPSHSN